jgi:hypothetical protein
MVLHDCSVGLVLELIKQERECDPILSPAAFTQAMANNPSLRILQVEFFDPSRHNILVLIKRRNT